MVFIQSYQATEVTLLRPVSSSSCKALCILNIFVSTILYVSGLVSGLFLFFLSLKVCGLILRFFLGIFPKVSPCVPMIILMIKPIFIVCLGLPVFQGISGLVSRSDAALFPGSETFPGHFPKVSWVGLQVFPGCPSSPSPPSYYHHLHIHSPLPCRAVCVRSNVVTRNVQSNTLMVIGTVLHCTGQRIRVNTARAVLVCTSGHNMAQCARHTHKHLHDMAHTQCGAHNMAHTRYGTHNMAHIIYHT